MAYKALRNFQQIFGRGDFNYVSGSAHIDEISEIILIKLPNPDGNEESHIAKIGLFIRNLNSFFGWLNKKFINEVNEGNNITQQILLQVTGLLKQPIEKRTAISGGYLRKFNKTFLYGLSRIMAGIKIAFRPDVVSATNIDANQLRRFILDKIEGLGNRYEFNKMGNNSVPEKLNKMGIQELIVAERLLLNPGKARTTRNGWIDFGQGKQIVRILVRPRALYKDQVCFLCRVSDHDDYEGRLDIPAKKFEFSAA